MFSIGSLNNYEGDGNEDGKKAVGLNKKKQQLCTCVTLFVHFFAVAVRLQRESAYFDVLAPILSNTTVAHVVLHKFFSKTTFHSFPHVFDLRSQFTTFFFFS